MSATPITIYVDADACPVKAEIYRVAGRHGVRTYVVANSFLMVPNDPLVERVIVGSGFDAADDWIAERAARGAVVVTTDVPLAHRCVTAGADVIAPQRAALHGKLHRHGARHPRPHGQPAGVGRDHGGPKPFSAKDRSAFLSALDLAIVRLKRAGFGTTPG
jgi:uncharacterized protein YaiI (UPF0178 family)